METKFTAVRVAGPALTAQHRGWAVVETYPDGTPMVGALRFASREAAQAHITMMTAKLAKLYDICPACSSDRAFITVGMQAGDSVRTCRVCAAIYGRVESAADYVELGKLSNRAPARYFDFTDAKGRVHGWLDHGGRVAQIASPGRQFGARLFY